MYLTLLGNLSLWSVIPNASSFSKRRRIEAESLNREVKHSINV